jgi:hypothetical protein
MKQCDNKQCMLYTKGKLSHCSGSEAVVNTCPNFIHYESVLAPFFNQVRSYYGNQKTR